jgi:manganese transport protein
VKKRSPETQTKLNSGSHLAVRASEILAGRRSKTRLSRLWPFLGPAFIASIAYVDPGNFATNIQGGAKYGYTLLWVVVASNLMAMLIQGLSAKLGIATGHNLAELCRMHFPKPVVWIMWVLMELVAMATDLAEFLGAALWLNLLFGIPLWIAGLITFAVTFMILVLQNHGFRAMKAVIIALLGNIALCYVIETVLDKPDWGQVLRHAVVPQFQGSGSVILAAGILGATVMPHVIFLNSSLTQGRIIAKDSDQRRLLFRFEIADITIAMGTLSDKHATTGKFLSATTYHVLEMAEKELEFFCSKKYSPSAEPAQMFPCKLVAAIRDL